MIIMMVTSGHIVSSDGRGAAGEDHALQNHSPYSRGDDQPVNCNDSARYMNMNLGMKVNVNLNVMVMLMMLMMMMLLMLMLEMDSTHTSIKRKTDIDRHISCVPWSVNFQPTTAQPCAQVMSNPVDVAKTRLMNQRSEEGKPL